MAKAREWESARVCFTYVRTNNDGGDSGKENERKRKKTANACTIQAIEFCGLEIAFWCDFDLIREQNEILFLETLHKYNIHHRRCSNRWNIIKWMAKNFLPLKFWIKFYLHTCNQSTVKRQCYIYFFFFATTVQTCCFSSVFLPHLGAISFDGCRKGNDRCDSWEERLNAAIQMKFRHIELYLRRCEILPFLQNKSLTNWNSAVM